MLQDAPWAFTASPENDRGSDPVQVAGSMQGDGYAIVGAFEGSELAAVAVVIRESAAKRQHIARLISVFCHPQFRGKGYAAGTVREAVNVARSWEGVDWVQLSVTDRAVTAKRIYEACGFRAWGTEPDALRVDGGSYVETHMALRLADKADQQPG